MEKKKVAILLPWLKMGGTNKIALNFMNELSNYCDITLILSEKTGELLSDLPNDIKLVIDEMKDFRVLLKEDIHHFRIKYIIKDIIYYLKIRFKRDSINNYKYLVTRHDYISNLDFDCAISYHGQSPERLLNLLYRIHSKKKVAWIHGEMSFSKTKCQQLSKYYQQLDHFFFVSNPTQDSFVQIYPFVKNKATVYYNPIDKNEIMQKANEKIGPLFSNYYTNLLTVGRISSEKGQDMIPYITKKLLDNDCNVRWYIIGDGDMRVKIEKIIEELNLKDRVFLLGTKKNPYCYMKECDIYIQPSYTEGYSTTICEAGILGKAIIGTKPSGGIKDQIEDGKNGLIVEANIEALTTGIKILLDNKVIKRKFESNIIKKNFEGKGEIFKFLKFINEK